MVFSLLVDREGMPLGFDVYLDNTFEGKTMPSVISKLREKKAVKQRPLTVVGAMLKQLVKFKI